MRVEQPRVTAIVLAAGGGTRMKSGRPKVLHHAAGRPLLAHVLAALRPLALEERVVVSSRRRDEVEASMAQHGFASGITYAVQDPPRGTGDAVRAALDLLGSVEGLLLVAPGDTPMLETETIRALLHVHGRTRAAATLLTAHISDPSGYGRVVRDGSGEVVRVVEDRDASYEEREIDEINAGVYIFDVDKLSDALMRIDSTNAQGEYYLTDVIALFHDQGDRVSGYRTNPQEVIGVNSRAQLARVAEMMRRRTSERFMDLGVTIVDPTNTYIDSTVSIDKDATIYPFTFLEGDTSVGEGAEVGPQARLVDSSVGPGARVSFSVVVGSEIGPGASVGPFASLRPGSRLERGAKVGTFVETKKTTLGEDSKANHLAYLGDADIGRDVNIGAGSITCNWDGRDKHPTFIDDEAYISSDTMMVAPVRIGKRAATGAGAVVKDDIPDDALAVGVPARIIEGRGNRMAKDPEGSGPHPSADLGDVPEPGDPAAIGLEDEA